MTFEAYWQRLVDANPALGKDGIDIRLKPPELKRLLKKAYHMGRSDGPPDFDVPDVFRKIFGTL